MKWGPITLAGGALALCLAAGAGGARAGDLEEGIRLYDDLDFEAAAERLEAAVASGEGRAEVARAALYLGLAHFQLGDPDEARFYFSLALAYDGEIALPEGTSPKIAEVYGEVAERFDFPRPFSDREEEEEKAGEPEEEEAESAPPAAEPPEPKRAELRASGGGGGRFWTWTTAGATVAAGGTALAFALLARDTRNTIESGPHQRAELEELRDQLDRRATAANLLFAVTGTLAVSTAIVFFAEGAGGSREQAPAVAAGASDGGAWVSAKISF